MLNISKTESIWRKLLTVERKEMLVGVHYESPSAESSEVEELFETIMEASNSYVLIMRDFNVSTINWKELDAIGLERGNYLKLVLDCYLI